MKKSLTVCAFLLLAVAMLLPAASYGQISNAQAAITKMENDAVKADLTDDAAFYQQNLSDDWMGGTSRGTWETKQSVLADMKDTKNNKVNREQISDLNVRVDGDVAIATYKTTYDAMYHGQHMARTVISTDVFHMENGTWKLLSSHSSPLSK